MDILTPYEKTLARYWLSTLNEPHMEGLHESADILLGARRDEIIETYLRYYC